MKSKLTLTVLIVLTIASCRKRDVTQEEVYPFQFEKISKNNFQSLNWKEQLVNIVGTTTIFSDQSDLVEIVCGPENTSNPTLNRGCITMNLPTSTDPTLRRIRLRKGGYSGTLLSDITELKYSTYVVQNSPTAMVLQVDINNDNIRDFNIFFNPVSYYQGTSYPPVVFNTWQQWDALQGKWHIEGANLPEFPTGDCTIAQLTSASNYPNTRILDTPPAGHNGEGVRFTIGGTPRFLFDDTIGYFDALIIGTKDKKQPILYDFTCE